MNAASQPIRYLTVIAMLCLGQAALASDLAVSCTDGPDPASVGELVAYQVTVTNLDATAALQVNVTNDLPANCTLFSVSPSQGTWTQSGTTVAVSLGTLAVGGQATITLLVTPTQSGNITNLVKVSGTDVDINPLNNSNSVTTSIRANSFSVGPDLAFPRYLHTATRLLDGRIALIGGESPTGTLTSAEMFLPALQQFEAAGNMQYHRAWHAAASLPDGRVLVSGGFGYGRHAAAEIFNPTNGQFHLLGGIMSEARMRHTATTLTNGAILIVGGFTGGGTSERYTPYDDFFTAGPNLLHERVGHVTERLADGRLLVLGGYPTSTPQGELRCESYVPGSPGTFLFAGSLGINRYNFSTTLLTNGQVLITGGYRPDVNQPTAAAELFDPASGTARELTNMIWPRMFHTSTLLPNGRVLLTGGGTDAAELFDPAAEQFLPTVRMNHARSQHTASLLDDGRVLIAGGDQGDGNIPATTEFYDPLTVKTPPSISIADATVTEGNHGSNAITFMVRLSSPMGVAVSAAFATQPEGASQADFQSTSGTVLFAPGSTNQTLTVYALGDESFETNEPFVVRLSQPTNAVIARSEARGLILNDDPLPEISVVPLAWRESNIRTTNFLVEVVLSHASEPPVTVAFQTLGASAVAGSDFVATNGVLTFIGTTNLLVPIVVAGDILPEPDESFLLELSTPTNGTLTATPGIITIVNDDAVPGVVNNFSIVPAVALPAARIPSLVTVIARDAANNPVTEFNGSVLLMAGFTNLPPIHLDFEEGDFSEWSQLNGSAQPGPYEIRSFDTEGDGLSSFAFRISANHGSDGVQRSTFLEGPRRYYFSANIAQALEGGFNNGSSIARLVVGGVPLATNAFGTLFVNQVQRTNLFGQYDMNFSFANTISLLFDRPFNEFTPLGVYADDVVVSPVAFIPFRTGAFTNGEWTGPMALLEGVTNVVLFADDEERHRGSSAPFTVEPSLDLAAKLRFTPLAPRVGEKITLGISLTNLGPRSATGVVVTNLLPAALTFVSATSTQGSCTNIGDRVVCLLGSLAPSQSATVNVVVRATDTNSVSLLATAVVTEPDFNLANNSSTTNLLPSLPGIFGQSITIAEQSGGSTALFPVRLTGPFVQPVSVNYEVLRFIGGTGGDFITTNGTLAFPPGVTTQCVSAAVLDDLAYEGTESFDLLLSIPLNATLLNGTVFTATLLDNDPPPTLSISDAGALEGDAGTNGLEFTVVLAGLTELTTTVNFATANGSATAASDFLATNGVISFPAGITNRLIAVRVLGDLAAETNETFQVNLSNPGNATIARAQALGSIYNDDAELRILAFRVQGGDVVLTFPTAYGREYSIESIADFDQSWNPGFAQVIGNGGVMSVTNTGGGTTNAQFYRLKAH